MLPFKIKKNINLIDTIYEKYKDNIYNNFKSYFKKEWEKFFKNGILNYAFASKEQRSNSFIENYNKRIKSELCK